MKTLVMLHARFQTMSHPEQFWALFHATIDLVLLVFLVAAIIIGMTKDFGTFYFWVPFLGVVLWARVKQMRWRWSL